jgi:hypothetical protein
MKKPANTEKENVDRDRRDFLKNSVYAAYATPLITILLVDAQSAAASPGCPKPCKWPNPPPGLDCDGC